MIVVPSHAVHVKRHNKRWIITYLEKFEARIVKSSCAYVTLQIDFA